jgi:hypothetical protein
MLVALLSELYPRFHDYEGSWWVSVLTIFSGFMITQPGRKPKKSVVNYLSDAKKTYVTRKTKMKRGSMGEPLANICKNMAECFELC